MLNQFEDDALANLFRQHLADRYGETALEELNCLE